jgi:hypothetical protein
MDAVWWNNRFLLCDAYGIHMLNVGTKCIFGVKHTMLRTYSNHGALS